MSETLPLTRRLELIARYSVETTAALLIEAASELSRLQQRNAELEDVVFKCGAKFSWMLCAGRVHIWRVGAFRVAFPRLIPHAPATTEEQESENNAILV